jgi:iron complex transport system ATP-binding protein
MVAHEEPPLSVHEGHDWPLLDIQHISFGYGNKPLLYDVSLKVRQGEMVGLLGPNGSGKTTLLRLISGVLQPQEGAILLDGRDTRVWGRRGMARRVAVVPQELPVPFAFSVEQMVRLGRTPYLNLLGNLSKDDLRIVQEAMRAADVEQLAQAIYNELSGGERQRVIIAMALAQQPDLLLLDEPTAHLDIRYQIDVLERVQRLNREMGVTVIAAMHDLNLAARYFPRLVLFQRGVVADAGPAEALEPHLLRRVYGIGVQVGILRGAQHLSVLPPGEETAASNGQEDEEPARVHIMAGGGSGEVLMRALADAHVPFSAGALNIGDSDHTLALRLAQEVITEQPYTAISPPVQAQLRARLEQVAVLIVCPVPVGPGNLALLQEALEAARRGVQVVLLANAAGEAAASDETSSGDRPDERLLHLSGIEGRDYTQGAGVELVRRLLQAGARLVYSVGEAVEIARTRAVAGRSYEDFSQGGHPNGPMRSDFR